MASAATGVPGGGGAADPCSAEFRAAFICLNTQPPSLCGCFGADVTTFEEDMQRTARENFLGAMAFAAPQDPAFCDVANDRVCQYYQTEQSCCCQAETELARRCFVENVVINEMPMPLSAPCPNDCSPKLKEDGGGGGSAGVVIAILLILMLLGGGGAFWWRRRKLQREGKETTLPLLCPCLKSVLGGSSKTTTADDDGMSYSRRSVEGFSVKEIRYGQKKGGSSTRSGSSRSCHGSESYGSSSSSSVDSYQESISRRRNNPQLAPSKSHRQDEEEARRYGDRGRFSDNSSFVSEDDGYSHNRSNSYDDDEELNVRSSSKKKMKQCRKGSNRADDGDVQALKARLEETSKELHERMEQYQQELERVRKEKYSSWKHNKLLKEIAEDRNRMAHRLSQLEAAQQEQAAQLEAAERDRFMAQQRIAELEANNLKLAKELKRSGSASNLYSYGGVGGGVGDVENHNEEPLFLKKERRIAELKARNEKLAKELKKSGSQPHHNLLHQPHVPDEGFEDEYSNIPIPRIITSKNRSKKHKESSSSCHHHKSRGGELRRISSDSRLEELHDDILDDDINDDYNVRSYLGDKTGHHKKKKSKNSTRDPSVGDVSGGFVLSYDEQPVHDYQYHKKSSSSKKKHNRKSCDDPP